MRAWRERLSILEIFQQRHYRTVNALTLGRKSALTHHQRREATQSVDGMTVWDLTQHTYEEVRETIIDILLGREDVGPAPQQFDDVIAKVRFVFGKRSARPGLTFVPANPPNIHPHDAEFVRDVFWDLFRQGFITLGKDSSHNAGWSWFRLSHFASKTLQGQSPYRFHDRQSSERPCLTYWTKPPLTSTKPSPPFTRIARWHRA